MQKYDGPEKELTAVVCNKCGRELRVEDGYVKEGCFTANFAFGYFSRRDGMRHRFDLCEDCYDELLGTFAVGVEESEEKELV